jgi:hypothetical protein
MAVRTRLLGYLIHLKWQVVALVFPIAAFANESDKILKQLEEKFPAPILVEAVRVQTQDSPRESLAIELYQTKASKIRYIVSQRGETPLERRILTEKQYKAFKTEVVSQLRAASPSCPHPFEWIETRSKRSTVKFYCPRSERLSTRLNSWISFVRAPAKEREHDRRSTEK